MIRSKKSVEFIVLAPPYDPNVGGFVVMHQLCHFLNEIGHTCHLVPWLSSEDVSPIDDITRANRIFNQREYIQRDNFRVHSGLNTPIYRRPWRGIAKRDDLVVVYTEVVFGNPLRARNVARWLLHNPGFHTKDCYYPHGEVHFRYLDAYKPLSLPWIEVSDLILTVQRIPWEQYKAPQLSSPREGTAYIVRKGAGKPFVHDISNSVKIDGMSHAEISDVLRRVKTLISYDAYTLYSALAVVAGADSVVIPDPGVSVDEWMPNPEQRAGLAYDFDDLDRARAARNQYLNSLKSIDHQTENMVKAFADFWQTRLSGAHSNASAESSTIPD
jgi:hypothetical protein